VTSDHIVKSAVKEYETLAKLHHPNIVNVYALSLDEDSQKASLLMEFLPGHSLTKLLLEGHIFDGTAYIEIEVRVIARQLLSVLLYLNNENLAHRDINPSNILWTEAHATLIDFQTICAISPTEPQGVTGTPPYQAPEMWLPASYGSKADVWALGLVLKRLMKSSEVPMSVRGGEALDWCLQTGTEARCSAAEALNSTWLI
jgi:serine/threonine protein kinase